MARESLPCMALMSGVRGACKWVPAWYGSVLPLRHAHAIRCAALCCQVAAPSGWAWALPAARRGVAWRASWRWRT